MFTNDYVMRMIELFVRAVARITGLRESGEKEEAYALLQDTIKGVLGVNADTVDGLDYDTFVTIMAAGGALTPERYLLLSELMRIKGEMAQEEGREAIAAALLEKGLCLHLAAVQQEPALEQQPLPKQRLEQMREALEGYQLAERTYAMLARWQEHRGHFGQAEDALYQRMEADGHSEATVRDTLAFYDRLLALPEAALELGNLPLHEICQAREELSKRLPG